MDDFSDVKLERAESDSKPSPPRFPLWALITLALLLAAGALWYFVLRGAREGGAVDTTVSKPAAEPKPPPARLPAEPGDDIPLPPLNESDALVRDLVAQLSSHPRTAAWLATDRLIRNFTVVVLNIANGRTPSVHLKAVRPTGQFQIRDVGGATYIDPRSYRRYDGYAAAVAAVDARGAARLYATLKPRIQEAYEELGAPDGDFDRTFERAIVELLRTPVIKGDVRLKADSVSYSYADPSLESLSQAQRQFLRMGPRNVHLVQTKLREIARHLGIPDESLPPASQ